MAKRLPGYFLAVDVESSGIILPGTEKAGEKSSQCISIALLIIDSATLEEVDHYYSTIKFDPTRFDWSAQAEAIHGLSQQDLANSPDMATVAKQLLTIVNRWLPPIESKLFCGHNPGFDLAFFKQLLAEANETMKFVHRTLDAFSYGFAAFGMENSDDQFEFLGIDRAATHNALDDIRMSVSMLREVRKAGEMYRKRHLMAPAGLSDAAKELMKAFRKRQDASQDFRGLGIHDLTNNKFEKKEFVWVYYAGMGWDRYEPLEDKFDAAMQELLDKGYLKRGEVQRMPMIEDQEQVFTPVSPNFPLSDD